jgi:hypothetical protein
MAVGGFGDFMGFDEPNNSDLPSGKHTKNYRK